VTTILGLNPNRPAPAPPRRVAVDYNEWHIELVMWEYGEELLKRQRAAGRVNVPRSCRSMRRPPAAETAAVKPTALSAALEEGREILVKARVVTRTVAELLSARDIRTLLTDLKRRIDTRQQMGIAPGDPMEE
jgi:hypothetical protein